MRTGPACTQNCLTVPDNLCLDEQVTEGGMGRIGRRAGQDHFCVTCQLNRAWKSGPVRNAYSAQLDVVFGRNGHFGVRFQLKVASPKFRP